MLFCFAALTPMPCHHSLCNHMTGTKLKVVPELSATTQKTICQFYKFLTLALDRDKQLALHTHCLTTSDRTSSMQQGGGSVDSAASLEVIIKRRAIHPVSSLCWL